MTATGDGRRIDFNCDMGEGSTHDAAVVRWISSASIACGGHAGDDASMHRTVALCREAGVSVGAHPSLRDRKDFGRTERPTTKEEAYDLITSQVAALAAVCREEGVPLRHVKPHGALYNMAARDPVLADAIVSAVRDADPTLRLFGLSGSVLAAAGEAAGLRVAHEVFAERRYEADGSLTPRRVEGSVLATIEDAVGQALSLARDGVVIARTGERLALRADTICLHGDRPDALDFAAALRGAFDQSGIRVRAPGIFS